MANSPPFAISRGISPRGVGSYTIDHILNLYVLKPDVHAPVCDLGMVGSSHTVSIGLRLTVVSNFLGASGRVAPGRLVG